MRKAPTISLAREGIPITGNKARFHRRLLLLLLVGWATCCHLLRQLGSLPLLLRATAAISLTEPLCPAKIPLRFLLLLLLWGTVLLWGTGRERRPVCKAAKTWLHCGALLTPATTATELRLLRLRLVLWLALRHAGKGGGATEGARAFMSSRPRVGLSPLG